MVSNWLDALGASCEWFELIQIVGGASSIAAGTPDKLVERLADEQPPGECRKNWSVFSKSDKLTRFGNPHQIWTT